MLKRGHNPASSRLKLEIHLDRSLESLTNKIKFGEHIENDPKL